jgi:hypothetical protein
MGESGSSNRTVVNWLLLAALAVLFLTACAPGPNPAVDVPGSEGEIAGFITGLWQGAIAPVTFVISLFTENVSVYEVHNNGGWYDLGFVLGAGILFGGGAFGSRRK